MKIIIKVIHEFTTHEEAEFFIDQCVEDGEKLEVVYDETITKM